MARILTAGAVALLALTPAAASAFTTANLSLPAAAAKAPLPLDPSIPAAAWSAGAIPPGTGFEDLTTRAPAPHRTDVWMMYDAKNLYVAFHAEQQGTPIVATQSTNDVGFGTDDFVGVGIDTSGNGSQVYYFETTPKGIRYEQASENARYRPHWQAAAAQTADGWNAVMIIPLNVMRLRTGNAQTWRINFIRNVAAPAEHYTWAYDGVMSDGPIGNAWPNVPDARFWPYWTGIAAGSGGGSRPKPRLELYGLESVGRDRNVFQQADGEFLRQNVRVTGADLTYPITNTINFVGTVNPDFSNVEIDQQTIAPQEFRRFLQEYRPFFSQGANFITTNTDNATTGQLFYSPSVGPFDRGEKIEGTFGKQSFGVLNFRGFDQTTGNTFNDTAFGYQHALGDRTFTYWVDGVLARHSVGGNDTSFEYGTKGRNLHTGLVWGTNFATELNPALPNRIGHNGNGFIDVHKPNYEVFFSYTDISPNYNPVDGIIPDSDLRGFVNVVNFNGSMKGVKNYLIGANLDRFIDRSGAVHQADANLFLNAALKNGFSLNGVSLNIAELRSYSLIDPTTSHTNCNDRFLPRSYFSGYPGYFCGRTDTFNQLQIPIGYRDGTPTPTDLSVNFGQFGFGLLGSRDNGPDYLHLYTLSTSRPIGRMFSLGLEYDGSVIRAESNGMLDSQWLRRISIGAQLGPNTNLTVSLRSINGRGGFSPPGMNVSAAFHQLLRNGDEYFINFGTPAAPTTLNRVIFKYLFRFGGDAGT